MPTPDFTFGDELIKILTESQAAVRADDPSITVATPRELHLVRKYTAIRPILVPDDAEPSGVVPGAHTAWLYVGVQHFCIGRHSDTAAGAAWECWMCAKALAAVIAEESPL
jgi:hypothetical protein